MATAGRGTGEAPCGVATGQVSEEVGQNFHISTRISVGCLISIFSFPDCPAADGMDRDDSYPDQSCPMANHHRGTIAGSHWEDLCSSASICSQSSDEEMKPIGHSKGELYPPGGDTRDYPPAVVNLLPHSGPSAGMGPSVDLGGPPYSGKASTHHPFISHVYIVSRKRVLKHFRFLHLRVFP